MQGVFLYGFKKGAKKGTETTLSWERNPMSSRWSATATIQMRKLWKFTKSQIDCKSKP